MSSITLSPVNELGRNVHTIAGFDVTDSDHSTVLKTAFEASPGPWLVPKSTTLKIAYGTNIDPYPGLTIIGADAKTSKIQGSGFTPGDSNQSNPVFNIFGKGNPADTGGVACDADKMLFKNLTIDGGKSGYTMTTATQQQPAVFGFYGEVPAGTPVFLPYRYPGGEGYDWRFEDLRFENIPGFTIHCYGYERRVLIDGCVTDNANNGMNVNSAFGRITRCWFERAEGVECAGYGFVVDSCVFLEANLGGVVMSSTGNHHGGRIANCIAVGTVGNYGFNVLPDTATGNAVTVVACLAAFNKNAGFGIGADRCTLIGNHAWDNGWSTGTGGAKLGYYINGNDNIIADNHAYTSNPKTTGLKMLDGTALTLSSDSGFKIEGDRNRLTNNHAKDAGPSGGSYDFHFAATAQDSYFDMSNSYTASRLLISAGATFARGSSFQFPAGSVPTAAVDFRGCIALTEGGAGVADVYQICNKDAADAYAWRTLF